MDKKKQTRMARNLTAKHARKYNRATVFVDRKKETKKYGKTKHKSKNYQDL